MPTKARALRRPPYELCLVVVLAVGLQAHGQEQYPPASTASVEGRLRQLEERQQHLLQGYEELRKHEPQEHDAPEAGGEAKRLPVRARFDDGFLLSTEDDAYTLHIHLLNQTDFKVFTPGDQQPARGGVYDPRFRVYFEGHLQQPYEYELSIQRSVEGTFDILDANVNFHFWDQFQVKLGRFLVPYSYDWYDHLEQYFITPERSLFPLNFGLSREAGIMGWGKLFDERVDYAVGFFDGQLVGLADTNTTRDGVGYLNMRPFLRSEQFPALRFLNLGGSLALGLQAFPVQPLPLRTSVQSSENDEAAQAASAIFLAFDPTTVAQGSRTQGALHLAWYVQQFSLEAEWQAGTFSYHHIGTAPPVEVPVSGYHVSLGYFLTGETVEDRTTVVPLRPFSPVRGSLGPGAIELFCRYSQLDLDEKVFSAGLADAGKWTRSAYVTDTGFNWYMNRFIKFYFDWQHSIYGTPVLINEGKQTFSRTDDLWWIRCQIYY